ncbi:arginase family protein [Actinomadura logoneensis]|uniref:Arginase family protein n=1 Tax=Actinomadura logoneensis TaxID=2293572 RepID=A0A372JD37_9ACTN|nr:arginase family protein [Actinomadura logoneensis]RFU37744.1 arginase family protein [Actinomadura logoneensis]
MTRRVALLDAPSNLGLRPLRAGHVPGTRHLPEALRAHGLATRLGAELDVAEAGRVEPVPYASEPDPVTGYRNGPAHAEYTRRLAGRVGELLDDGAFPLVLGGDCGILLGPLLALRRRGDHGLAYIDGHADYAPPRDRAGAHGTRNVAGYALRLATGHGPAGLADLDGLRPYVAEERTVALGYQWEPEDHDFVASEVFETSALAKHSSADIRARGGEATGRAALDVLEDAASGGFWIHLDADVLDRGVMPAVDSPNPDGLSLEALTGLLAVLLASPRAVGMNVAIYDPDVDPDGSAGAALTGVLVNAFTAAHRADAAV